MILIAFFFFPKEGEDENLVALMKEDSSINREREYKQARLQCFKKTLPRLQEICLL